jgi:hypothetical protein
MMGGALLAVLWVLGMDRWHAVDPQAPGKMLAQEVFETFRARLFRRSRASFSNGSQIFDPDQPTSSSPEGNPPKA